MKYPFWTIAVKNSKTGVTAYISFELLNCYLRTISTEKDLINFLKTEVAAYKCPDKFDFTSLKIVCIEA